MESANVLYTWFMVLHGPAHGVWKYRAINLESLDLVSSVNCCSLSTSITPIVLWRYAGFGDGIQQKRFCKIVMKM